MSSTAAGPAPYHRLTRLRPSWSAPSKPLLTVLAAFAAYVVLASVLLVLTILVLALLPGVNVALDVTSGDPTSGLDVGLALAMGALWLPAGMFGVRIGGWRPLATAWSVAAQFRRELLTSTGTAVAVGALIAVLAALVAGMIAGDGTTGGASAGPVAGGPVLPVLAVALVVLVLAPLQAAGIELTMRGVLMQAAGTWLRSPLLPVGVATAITLIGRDLTAAVLLPALALALAAALLTFKSGGLELPILLTSTVTVVSLVAAAVGAGTAGGAGAAAMVAASSAPGTSSAALGAADGTAALAGGITGAVALLALTMVMMLIISRREGIGLLEPVTRDGDEPAPEPVPI